MGELGDLSKPSSERDWTVAIAIGSEMQVRLDCSMLTICKQSSKWHASQGPTWVKQANRMMIEIFRRCSAISRLCILVGYCRLDSSRKSKDTRAPRGCICTIDTVPWCWDSAGPMRIVSLSVVPRLRSTHVHAVHCFSLYWADGLSSSEA